MVMFTSRAHNMSDVSELEEIATHVLVVEVVCHHGRTRYIFQVITFAKLNASCPVSLICDNCPTNQGVYDKFRGQGRLYFERLGRYVYCVCDYVHIFENFRNNWITSGDASQVSFSRVKLSHRMVQGEQNSSLMWTQEHLSLIFITVNQFVLICKNLIIPSFIFSLFLMLSM